MDRELKVLKDGYLLAEYSFKYTRQASGKAHVTTYSSYDIGDGIKTVHPMYKYDTHINHPHELTTIAAIKAFDLNLVQNDSYIAKELTGNLEFVYEPRHYRYVIVAGEDVIGIADIQASFDENKKELQFISGRGIKEDQPLSSDSIEGNITLLNRLGELEWINFYNPTYKEVPGSHY